MTQKNLNHKSFLALVTCVATVCILFMGMRIPDLAPCQRPKPKPRAYIEQTFKTAKEAPAKKSVEVHDAVLTTSAAVGPAVIHPIHHAALFNATAHPHLTLTNPRAPPVLTA